LTAKSIVNYHIIQYLYAKQDCTMSHLVYSACEKRHFDFHGQCAKNPFSISRKLSQQQMVIHEAEHTL